MSVQRQPGAITAEDSLPAPAGMDVDSLPPQELMPREWTLTVERERADVIRPWENVLARRTYYLTHPARPERELYCYAVKRSTGAGGRWTRRYAGSVQANGDLLRAWTPRDGWTDEAGRCEDLVATCARIFREASAGARPSKT